MIINRPYYLEKLIDTKENGMLKIITGIRRSGKSFLLKTLYKNYLLEHGIASDHIIIYDLESWHYRDYHNPDYLLTRLEERVNNEGMYYLIIDEVQKIENFTEVLATIGLMENVDCYATGSNSHLLSSDIATEFRGRGDEIHIRPLSFAEYSSACEDMDISDVWIEYLNYGGLPKLLSMKGDERKQEYLRNLFRTVYLRDIFERYTIVNKPEFEELSKVLSSSIGAPVNAMNLANTFKSIKKVKNISDKTITTYIDYLQEAYMIEGSERYDIKGKRYIGSLSKFYFQDIGLRNAIIGFRQTEYTHLMENVLYNELRLRGYKVDVGNIHLTEKNKENKQQRKTLEVDFIAEKGNRRLYIQSVWHISDEEKMKQEVKSLNLIRDNFEKIVIVGEKIKPSRNDEGILFVSIYDFLLSEKYA